VLVGLCGVLAAKNLGRLTAYMIVISVGTLLIGFTLGRPGIAAGLYYLPHSTFAAAVLFLLAESLRRRRHTKGDSFVPDVDLPHPLLWGGLFFVAAVAVTGLPPLSGFFGKLLILDAAAGRPLLWLIILASAFAAVVALALAGSQIFFAGSSRQDYDFSDDVALEPQAISCELLAIFGLLSLIALLTIAAGPIFEFTQSMASQLASPDAYIDAVLGGGL
jgi:multicomponent K+:H+ antiporter subunit D